MRQHLCCGLAAVLLLGGTAITQAQTERAGGRQSAEQNSDRGWVNRPNDVGPTFRPSANATQARRDRLGWSDNEADAQNYSDWMSDQNEREFRSWYPDEDPRNRSARADTPARDSENYGDGNNDGGWSSHESAAPRKMLTDQLRQSGLRNIQILDTTYLVRAKTQDGRTVLMIVDPPNSANGSRQASSREQFYPSQPLSYDENDDCRNGSDPAAGCQGRIVGGGSNMESIIGKRRLRAMLQARGYSDLTGLHRQGNTWVGSADWYGSQVNLRIDGRNGYVIEPSHISADQIKTMLDDQGWEDIRQIEQQGASYQAQASQDGKNYTLWIDGRNGRIDKRVASSQGSSGNEDQSTGSTKPSSSGVSGSGGSNGASSEPSDAGDESSNQ